MFVLMMLLLRMPSSTCAAENMVVMTILATPLTDFAITGIVLTLSH
jgi:hypothetical protein